MLLKEKLLEDFTKEEMLGVAKHLGLNKVSSLKKDALIEKIVERFCSEDELRRRMACLTDEQIKLIIKACKKPVDLKIDDIMNGMQMCSFWFVYFDEDTDYMCVFEDIAKTFVKIYDDDFKVDQRKKGWLMKCINFFVNYYGIAPIEKIYEMYKQRVRASLDEMINTFLEMPLEYTESDIFTMEELGMEGWPESEPIYSDKGILVHVDLFENDTFDDLLDEQIGKDFYVPSVNQIEELVTIGYEQSNKAYQKLKTFLMKKQHLDDNIATTVCLRVWANSFEGESPTDLINEFQEDGIIAVESEEDISIIVNLLMNAHNNTRMKENRGHKPTELAHDFRNGFPTIVPGSTQAANMLREAMPELSKMGIPIDFNSNADTVPVMGFPNGIMGDAVVSEKKIYPNDPCPCGSGKKYKKCCGKK